MLNQLRTVLILDTGLTRKCAERAIETLNKNDQNATDI